MIYQIESRRIGASEWRKGTRFSHKERAIARIAEIDNIILTYAGVGMEYQVTEKDGSLLDA